MSDPFAALVSATNPAMVVVTAATGDRRDGCLVGFHSQCSIAPPRYAVWLSVANLTYDLACSTDHLAVHLLGALDGDLAALFGGRTGDDGPKLDRCAWHEGPHGTVLVDRLATRLVGRIVTVHDVGGDHVCFVLEPLAVEGASPGRPVDVLRLAAVSDVDPGHEATDRRA